MFQLFWSRFIDDKWDGEKHCWIDGTGFGVSDFRKLSKLWIENGANVIGGCCKTTPQTISAIRGVVDKIDSKL